MSHLSEALKKPFSDIARSVDDFVFIFHRIDDDNLINFIGGSYTFYKPQVFVSYFPDRNAPKIAGNEMAFAAAMIKAEEYAVDLTIIQYIFALCHSTTPIGEFEETELETIEEWCGDVLEMDSWNDLGKNEAQTILQAIQTWREWKTPPLNSSPNHGFVYLAYCSTGHYKIGFSKQPDKRIKHFDTQMPVDVTIIHTIETDDAPELEKVLQRHYRPKRQKGEWFALEKRDVETLKAIPEWRHREWHFVLNGRHQENFNRLNPTKLSKSSIFRQNKS
jgi:hypothetical protein